MPHTVTLDEEAFERLESRRRDGESVSDVVCRLVDERPLAKFFGVLDDEAADELEAAIEHGRNRTKGKRYGGAR
jgi:predicted CopG family antitoxin